MRCGIYCKRPGVSRVQGRSRGVDGCHATAVQPPRWARRRPGRYGQPGADGRAERTPAREPEEGLACQHVREGAALESPRQLVPLPRVTADAVQPGAADPGGNPDEVRTRPALSLGPRHLAYNRRHASRGRGGADLPLGRSQMPLPTEPGSSLQPEIESHYAAGL